MMSKMKRIEESPKKKTKMETEMEQDLNDFNGLCAYNIKFEKAIHKQVCL